MLLLIQDFSCLGCWEELQQLVLIKMNISIRVDIIYAFLQVYAYRIKLCIDLRFQTSNQLSSRMQLTYTCIQMGFP